MSDKFQVLSELGAGEFEHLDGSLIEHLKGTRELLYLWGASTELQDAGLYHAAYGTDGFRQNIVSTDQRTKIAEVIGDVAEGIVYQYCACDRDFFFARIGKDERPEFRNRFTGETYCLSETMLRNFCELTAANEIEIAIDNPKFMIEHGSGLNQLFIQMAPYLSVAAKAKAAQTFGAGNAKQS